MKKDKILDSLKGKDRAELLKMISGEKESLRSLKFDLLSGKVKNVKEIKSTRKHIARIYTILNSRESSGRAESIKS